MPSESFQLEKLPLNEGLLATWSFLIHQLGQTSRTEKDIEGRDVFTGGVYAYLSAFVCVSICMARCHPHLLPSSMSKVTYQMSVFVFASFYGCLCLYNHNCVSYVFFCLHVCPCLFFCHSLTVYLFSSFVGCQYLSVCLSDFCGSFYLCLSILFSAVDVTKLMFSAVIHFIITAI